MNKVMHRQIDTRTVFFLYYFPYYYNEERKQRGCSLPRIIPQLWKDDEVVGRFHWMSDPFQLKREQLPWNRFFSRSIHLWRNKHLTRVSHVCSLLRIQSCVGRRGSLIICDVCRCGWLTCLLRTQSCVGRDPLDYLLSYVNTKDFWTANNP